MTINPIQRSLIGLQSPLLERGEDEMSVQQSPRPLYFETLKECNKVAGEENINEFLPYTILSVANKVFYAVVFGIYFNDVQKKGGDSSNGVTYDSPTVNIINASSVVITGFALTMLSVLSVRNAWVFRRVVQKVNAPLFMKSSLQFMNNIRLAKIGHTFLAAMINMANGIFQLLSEPKIVFNHKIIEIGKKAAKDTAAPALLLILTKNLFDFISSFLDIANCQKNIMNIKKINEEDQNLPFSTDMDLEEDLADSPLSSTGELSRNPQQISLIKTGIIFHLFQKRRELFYTMSSTALVSTGMTAVFIGLMGYADARVGACIFLGAATLGQLIPLIRKRLACSQTNNYMLNKQAIQLHLFKRDKKALISAISNNLSNSRVNNLICQLQSNLFCGGLNPQKEESNGLEGLAKILQ